MWKQRNLLCGIWGRGVIRNKWHGSVNNDTLTFTACIVLKNVLSKVTSRKLILFPHVADSAHCNSLQRWQMKNACSENLDLSLILKNQPSLLHYLKGSNPTPPSNSTIQERLLSRPLSHEIFVIFLWNFILRICIAQLNNKDASFKPHADVSMRRRMILCATGMDLCGRRITLNSSIKSRAVAVLVVANCLGALYLLHAQNASTVGH